MSFNKIHVGMFPSLFHIPDWSWLAKESSSLGFSNNFHSAPGFEQVYESGNTHGVDLNEGTSLYSLKIAGITFTVYKIPCFLHNKQN